jgi:hypothetical protein
MRRMSNPGIVYDVGEIIIIQGEVAMYYTAIVDHSSINIKASSLRQAMRSASNAFKGLDQKDADI